MGTGKSKESTHKEYEIGYKHTSNVGIGRIYLPRLPRGLKWKHLERTTKQSDVYGSHAIVWILASSKNSDYNTKL